MTAKEMLFKIQKIREIPFRINYKWPEMFKWMDDEQSVKFWFWCVMRKKLDLEHPKTYNEKLQWLKLYDHRPVYQDMVDKVEAKKLAAKVMGEECIIPTLGVWTQFDDIDFDGLPNKFVLKCTHDSGGLVICTDKSKLDIKAARKKIARSMKRNFFLVGREWPYKNITPRIIAEAYMEDTQSKDLVDYKIFCFNGKAECVMVVADRAMGNPKYYFFDKEWKLRKYNRLCRSLPDDFQIPKPKEMDQLFAIAEKLCAEIPQLRVDLYVVDGQIYFGEYTFFNQSGLETGFDLKTDMYLGSLIQLPTKKRM